MVQLGPPARTDPFPYDETISPFLATATAATGTNSLVLIEAPRRLTPLSVGHIDLYIGVSSGNIDVGVYAFDGTTWTLLTSSGSTAAGTATSKQTLALGSTVIRAPGDRWFYGLVADNGTVTFGRAVTNVATSITAAGSRALLKTSAFPLAANAASFVLAGTSGGTLVVPWLRGSA